MENVMTQASGSAAVADGKLIDQFIAKADVRMRHEIVIHAPAPLVFDVARNFDPTSIPVVRGIFWLRAKVLGAQPLPARWSKGLFADTVGMGWEVLAHRPGRELVMGSATQPWRSDVTLTPIGPDRFAEFAGAGLVKIVWTLEAEPIHAELTRFATETRVRATDDAARKTFRRYWRSFGVGILLIRWLALRALRHEAEWRYRRVSRLSAA